MTDTIGIDTVYRRILEFRESLDPHYWEPAPLLERLARSGSTFANWQREHESRKGPR